MDAIQFITEIGRTTAALLIVIDPLGVMPVVISLSSHMLPRDAKLLIFKVSASATVLLLFFTVTGTWLLDLFGVTINDLRISGGLLLLLVAFRLIISGKITIDIESEYDAAVAPLISPLLIGPGAITAAVVLAAIHGVLITILAGIAAMIISMLILLVSPLIYRLLGVSGTDLVSRIMGVLIAAIGISYIREGVFALIGK